MIDVGPSSLAGGAPRRSSHRYLPSAARPTVTTWRSPVYSCDSLLTYPNWNSIGGWLPTARTTSRRFARAVLIFGAGAGVGVGLSASLFLLVGVLLGEPVAALVLEPVILGWTGYDYSRAARQTGNHPGKLTVPCCGRSL